MVTLRNRGSGLSSPVRREEKEDNIQTSSKDPWIFVPIGFRGFPSGIQESQEDPLRYFTPTTFFGGVLRHEIVSGVKRPLL